MPGISVGRRGLWCGLGLLAAAGLWAGFGLPGLPFSEKPQGTAAPASSGRLTLAETAAMAVLGGIGTPEKAKLPNSLRQAGDGAADPSREEVLLAVIENGGEAEAAEAIRELAALGGDLNQRRLVAIMKDKRWPQVLREEAAKALLTSKDPARARLAVKVLAVFGGEENTESLRAMISDDSLEMPVRLEAALAMGIVGTPRAREALVDAFRIFPDPEIHEQILGALGQFPFAQIEGTWRQILSDPNTPPEVRVAAVDALAGSSPDVLPFLKAMAQTDADPEVREKSAWAISAVVGESGGLGPDLAQMAIAEPEADVRRRLYEALPMQAVNPSESLLPQVQGETDFAARVAGFNAMADAVNRGASTNFAKQFDDEVVPDLTQIAVSNQSIDVRTRAVFALQRAGTSTSRKALLKLSQGSDPKIAQAARMGLTKGK